MFFINSGSSVSFQLFLFTMRGFHLIRLILYFALIVVQQQYSHWLLWYLSELVSVENNLNTGVYAYDDGAKIPCVHCDFAVYCMIKRIYVHMFI